MDNMANEDKGTGINYGKVVLRDNHGTADPSATMDRINAELVEWIAKNEIDTPRIAAAVSTAIEKFPKAQKAQLDLEGLTKRAMDELKDLPYGAESRIGKRIKDFVRGESDRFEDSRGESGICFIARGKNGGVKLRTEAFVAEYRASLAKKEAAAKAQ
jgi:hypothetical protein